MKEEQEFLQIINKAKNILISVDKKKENIISALALFYAFKKLSKEVNLLLEEVPKEIQFLLPSLEFLTFPNILKLLVRTPQVKINEIEYQKNDNILELSFYFKEGLLKKEHFSFLWDWQKPDLFISLEDDDLISKKFFSLFSEEDQISFINLKKDIPFSSENIVEKTLGLIKSFDNKEIFDENISTCFLVGFLLIYENFLKKDLDFFDLEKSVYLIKKQINWKKVFENL